jgi:hypothetical protein
VSDRAIRTRSEWGDGRALIADVVLTLFPVGSRLVSEVWKALSSIAIYSNILVEHGPTYICTNVHGARKKV